MNEIPVSFIRPAIYPMFKASYSPYRNPTARSIINPAMLPMTMYLNDASADSPLIKKATRAQDEIDAISKNTKKLNRSPVKTIPKIPTINNKKRV